VAPQGFTRRYGNIIAARIGVVGRDGLDACIYKGAVAPVKKAPPVVTRKPRPVPGEEFESTKPLPPVDASEPAEAPAAEPSQTEQQPIPPPPSADQPAEPGNGP
jgi:monofunctional biosynthetic peptidoglycan transglycosylase